MGEEVCRPALAARPAGACVASASPPDVLCTPPLPPPLPPSPPLCAPTGGGRRREAAGDARRRREVRPPRRGGVQVPAGGGWGGVKCWGLMARCLSQPEGSGAAAAVPWPPLPHRRARRAPPCVSPLAGVHRVRQLLCPWVQRRGKLHWVSTAGAAGGGASTGGVPTAGAAWRCPSPAPRLNHLPCCPLDLCLTPPRPGRPTPAPQPLRRHLRRVADGHRRQGGGGAHLDSGGGRRRHRAGPGHVRLQGARLQHPEVHPAYRSRGGGSGQQPAMHCRQLISWHLHCSSLDRRRAPRRAPPAHRPPPSPLAAPRPAARS